VGNISTSHHPGRKFYPQRESVILQSQNEIISLIHFDLVLGPAPFLKGYQLPNLLFPLALQLIKQFFSRYPCRD